MDGGASGCKAFCHCLDSCVILLCLCCQYWLPLCIKMYITEIYFTMYYPKGEPIGASQPRVARFGLL